MAYLFRRKNLYIWIALVVAIFAFDIYMIGVWVGTLAMVE